MSWAKMVGRRFGRSLIEEVSWLPREASSHIRWSIKGAPPHGGMGSSPTERTLFKILTKGGDTNDDD